MVKTTFTIEMPKTFNFKRTLRSHGWSELLPFIIDEENFTLSRRFNGENALMKEGENGIYVEIEGKITDENQVAVSDKIRHIFRLDDDLREFYKILKSEKEFAWIAKQGAGRMLRSPTVFEDLVKTICTTNCTWGVTRNLTRNLVEKLGANGDFPTAEIMATQPLEFYKDEIRAGYRAAYLLELAEKVVNEQIKPESWLNSELPTKDLKKEIKKVKGVGNYAAENLLKLLGRYDDLALDSWLRPQFYKYRNSEIPCEDKKIEEFYARFGEWKGLVLWCDMTKNWLAEK